MRSRSLIAGYVARAALPYVLLTLALLTALLFVQQSSRFAEIACIPRSLCRYDRVGRCLPTERLDSLASHAVLAGIIIGYARMGSDSEIVAMRAAGVGTWTIFARIGHWRRSRRRHDLHSTGRTPRAARDLKRAAVEAALRKLESP